VWFLSSSLSLRTYFKSLSLSWSLGVRSLSLSLSLGARSLSLSWSLGVRSLSLSWSLGVRSLLTSLVPLPGSDPHPVTPVHHSLENKPSKTKTTTSVPPVSGDPHTVEPKPHSLQRKSSKSAVTSEQNLEGIGIDLPVQLPVDPFSITSLTHCTKNEEQKRSSRRDADPARRKRRSASRYREPHRR